MGRDHSTSSQVKPHAAGGGRPQSRRSNRDTSHNTPQRLGARPSTTGQALSEDYGMPPTGDERRRVGNSAPEAQASAAWSCDTAAAQGLRERPQRGRSCRVPGAHKHECHTTEGGKDPEEENAARARAREAHDDVIVRRVVDEEQNWTGAPSSSAGVGGRGKLPENTEDTLNEKGSNPPHVSTHETSDDAGTRRRTGDRNGKRGDSARPCPPKRRAEVMSACMEQQHQVGGAGAAASKRPRIATERSTVGRPSYVALTAAAPGGGAGHPTHVLREPRGLPGRDVHQQALDDHVQGLRGDRADCDHSDDGLVDDQLCHSLAEGHPRRLEGAHGAEESRVPPRPQCGNDRGPTEKSDRPNSSSFLKARSVDLNSAPNIARGRTVDLGWDPKPRSPPSSAATRSCRGPAGAQTPTVEGAANLEAIAAGKHGAPALGPAAAERPQAKPVERAAEPTATSSQSGGASSTGTDYVPLWMRTPAWLYLPHQEPPVATLHAGNDEVQGLPTIADGDQEPTVIRGRSKSPGTRKPTPLDRARERLAARNAHLAISLNLHAERVEKRKAQAAPVSGSASAAERLAAIRRRLHDRLDKGATRTPTGRDDASETTASGTVAEPARMHDEKEQPSKTAIGADLMRGRGNGDVPTATQAGHPWTQEGAEVQRQANARHRQIMRSGSGARSEEDDTPETGEWSIEDLKMHQNKLHAVGIRMTTACARRGDSNCEDGAKGTAEDAGGCVENRPTEEEGRRGGHVAPPNAASAAAASRVAWHTNSGHLRNDR